MYFTRADSKNIAAKIPGAPPAVVEAMARACRVGEAQFGGAAWRADQARRRGDSLQNILDARQLEEVLSAETPQRPTLALFAQFTSLIQQGDRSAATYKQRIYDHVGDVAMTAQRGGDRVPNISFAGASLDKPYHEARNKFTWDVEEAEAAARGDFSLLAEARNAAQRYHEIAWNRTFFYGWGELNMDGVVNFPNRISELAPADGTSSSRYFADKTPDLKARDLFLLTDSVKQDTLSAYDVTDVMLSADVYDNASTTRMTDGDMNTVLGFVQAQRPGVTFHRVNELGATYRTDARTAAVIDGSVDSTWGVAFDRSVVRFMAGMPFQVGAPVQTDAYTLEFGTRSRFGGIKSMKPLGIYTLREMAA